MLNFQNKFRYLLPFLLILISANIQAGKYKSSATVVVEAESGHSCKDVERSAENQISYIFPKTNWESWEVPRDSDCMVTYKIKFKIPGYYNLYARVKVGSTPRKDDSFFAAKGFGLKEIKKENWICVNELYSWGYTSKDSIVSKAGTAEGGVWKWINVTQGFCTPTEANHVFYVAKANQIVTFQIATREDGLFIDKFAFGPVGYDYTISQLDNGPKCLENSESKDDILNYLNKGFIDNKSDYIGKELNVLLNDLEIEIKGCSPIIIPNNRYIIRELSLSFGAINSSNINGKYQILRMQIDFEKPMQSASVWEFMKEHPYLNWTEAHNVFFGNQIIKDIRLSVF